MDRRSSPPRSRAATTSLAVVASCAWLATGSLRAQPPGRVELASRVGQQARATSDADSMAMLLKARVAQRRFEQTRRNNLPITDAYPSSRCDVRVGRFCYWHDEGFTPPAEPSRTATERKRFLARLADAGERLPRDEWILGQRVRYLVEDGRASEAATLAAACSSAVDSAAPLHTQIWCDELEGFARHATGEYAAAAQAYERALSSMSPEQRCSWNDISALLDGERAKRYRALACGERDAFERRFWMLARPLYLLPANDLRTEHLSRVVMARFERAARGAHDLAWGDDIQEIMTRYGWETAWSKRAPSLVDPTMTAVIGHEPTPGFDFTPDDAAFADPAAAKDEGWDPHDGTAWTRYAPRWGKALSGAPHQLAFFRRADTAVVVAAIDVHGDTLFRRDDIAAALAVVPDSSDSAIVARVNSAPRLARLVARAPWGRVLVSVEALDTAAHHAAWSRHGAAPNVAPDSALAISDVLLLERADSLPATLDDAARQARGTMRVRGESRLGAFWELYRAVGGDSAVRYTLTVKPRSENALRHLARRLGLVRASEPVRMQWEEPLAADHVVARALAIDLSTLPEGRYAMELTAESGGAHAIARREIEVAR